jgi:hypothetical protein
VLRIINIKGEAVYIRNLDTEALRNETIDVQHLSTGVYQVIISDGESIFRARMVIH